MQAMFVIKNFVADMLKEKTQVTFIEKDFY